MSTRILAVNLLANWWQWALAALCVGVSFGGKPAKSRNDSASGTAFPGQFLGQFSQSFGRPITAYDIAPLATGPGYGGPYVRPGDLAAGQYPNPSAPGGSSTGGPYQSTTNSLAPQRQPGDPVQPGSGGRGPGGGGPVQDGRGALTNVLLGGGEGGTGEQIAGTILNPVGGPLGDLLKAIRSGGGLPGDRTTPLQMYDNMVNYAPDGPAMRAQPAAATIPRLANAETIFTPGAQNSFDALGFGKAAPNFNAPVIAPTTEIQSPELAAARVNIPRGSLDAYENAAFQSQFNPVNRDLTRQAETADKSLKSTLANSGLSTSAAGIGLQRQQGREFEERRTAAASDAANRAAVQRGDVEFQASMQNAQLKQQANIQRAGFDLQAQTTNAANVLAGNSENAKNYLSTLGLNVEQAKQGRDSFLQLMGLRAADLERMDTQNRQNIETMMNTWLQQLGAVTDVGRFAVGAGASVGEKKPISILGGSAVSA